MSNRFRAILALSIPLIVAWGFINASAESAETTDRQPRLQWQFDTDG